MPSWDRSKPRECYEVRGQLYESRVCHGGTSKTEFQELKHQSSVQGR